MSAREDILAAIRANRPNLDAPAPEVPAYDGDYPSDRAGLVARFREALEAMGGQWADTLADGPATWIAERMDAGAVIVSNVAEVTGNREITPETPPGALEDVDTAVLRAAFGIAETGAVCFTENALRVNALAYLAQHLIVLLDPDTIVTTMHRAYARSEFTNARYTVFHAGPSATADIEGVLVRGAQGVRSLTVVPAQARDG